MRLLDDSKSEMGTESEWPCYTVRRWRLLRRVRVVRTGLVRVVRTAAVLELLIASEVTRLEVRLFASRVVGVAVGVGLPLLVSCLQTLATLAALTLLSRHAG